MSHAFVGPRQDDRRTPTVEKTSTRRRSWPLLALATVIAAASASCLQQADTVWVHDDGSVEFVSRITITDERFTPDQAADIVGDSVRVLEKAGWQVTHDVEMTSRPIRATVKGSGQLASLKEAAGYYRLERLDAKRYQVRFSSPDTQSLYHGASRMVTFRKPRGAGAVSVTDEAGKPVVTLRDVDEDEEYTITLP